MVLLTDLFSADELEQAISDKLVNRRYHSGGKLAILNYSDLAQVRHVWTDVTRACRGLIYDVGTLEIQARPWEKFFNWDQAEVVLPPAGTPLLRATKFDGSLGVLYNDGENWAVSTRGSFESEQAVWATGWLRRTLEEMDDALRSGVEGAFQSGRTFLFEIIYPENRIVVDYSDRESLVLLDVLDTETGEVDLRTFDEISWAEKAEKTLIPGGFQDTMAGDIPEGEEGFVLYWPGRGVRAKMKSAEYLALHRATFSLSEKTVWSWVRDGKDIEDLKAGIPDELYSFVDEAYNDLLGRALNTVEAGRNLWDRNQRAETKKEFASLISAAGKAEKAVAFLFWDNRTFKDILSIVWKGLTPDPGVRASSVRTEDNS